MSVSHFKIEERQETRWRRVVLLGELDIAGVPVLEARLDQLRGDRARVRLDLSALEFMDSSGLQLLLKWTKEARANGWNLEIDGEVAPAVRRVFELSGVVGFLSDGGGCAG
jgi:stage II sporulation protein AA (anti-sigma F factor antagonist)